MFALLYQFRHFILFAQIIDIKQSTLGPKDEYNNFHVEGVNYLIVIIDLCQTVSQKKKDEIDGYYYFKNLSMYEDGF